MHWRFIPLLDAPGSLQMAVDAWLFDQHCQGLQPATIRFYTWSPAAISLGHHQRHYPEAWKQLTWQGIPLDLVRRPTGGRAVLHQGDLTYAVITSGMPGNRMDAYHRICEFLITGWRSLHIPLDYGQAGRNYIHNPNCFGTATGADLVLPDGTKFIGSAQLRRGNIILQHGSMQLQPDPSLWQQVFGTSLAAVPSPFIPRDTLSVDRMIETLVAAASDCFGITLIPQPLSDEEWEMVKRSQVVGLLRQGT